MDTETHTNQQQNANRTYFIVFDKNGTILNINSTPVAKLKDSSMTQIESTNPICKKLIKGKYFLMLLPDDIIIKKNCTKEMIKLHNKKNHQL